MNNSLLLQEAAVVKCTKIQKKFHLILLSIVVFLFLCLPSSVQIVASAQNDLLTHEDFTNDFSVSYPSNWFKEDNVYGTHGVQFSPNPTTRDNVLIDVVQEPGADLEGWTQEKIGSISSRGASISLVNPTTLGDNPAYKVEYTWEGDKLLETWTLFGDKLYAISYMGVGEESYQQNLPAAQSIIDSFQFMTGEPTEDTALDGGDEGDENGDGGDTDTGGDGGDSDTGGDGDGDGGDSGDGGDGGDGGEQGGSGN